MATKLIVESLSELLVLDGLIKMIILIISDFKYHHVNGSCWVSIWRKLISPITISCDSAATLARAYSQIYNGKSRHPSVRHSMIRELIMNGVISIEFVRSQQNLADHLTKGLARDLVSKSVIGMGLKSN